MVGELSREPAKVVIGRWMTGAYKIFIFDQPTTGVDIGAKTEIYKQMVALAKKGVALYLYPLKMKNYWGFVIVLQLCRKEGLSKNFRVTM